MSQAMVTSNYSQPYVQVRPALIAALKHNGYVVTKDLPEAHILEVRLPFNYSNFRVKTNLKIMQDGPGTIVIIDVTDYKEEPHQTNRICTDVAKRTRAYMDGKPLPMDYGERIQRHFLLTFVFFILTAAVGYALFIDDGPVTEPAVLVFRIIFTSLFLLYTLGHFLTAKRWMDLKSEFSNSDGTPAKWS